MFPVAAWLCRLNYYRPRINDIFLYATLKHSIRIDCDRCCHTCISKDAILSTKVDNYARSIVVPECSWKPQRAEITTISDHMIQFLRSDDI